MLKELYHVELAEDSNEIKEFVPRGPSRIYEHEDGIIERICVSKTLNGCFGSAPWGGCNFEMLSEEQVFRVYEFNLGDIKEGNLIIDDYLYEKDLVRDAKIYEEYWVINQSIKPKNVFYMKVDKYHSESEDVLSYKELKQIEQDDKLLDELIDKCCTKVQIINYSIINKDNVKFGLLV